MKAKIALLWHQTNSANLGVGALTVANMQILAEAAAELGLDPEFMILGWKDHRPAYEGLAPVEDVSFRLRELVTPGGRVGKAMSQADIAFDIAGGDSFTDIYTFKRFWTVCALKLRALIAGTPLILSPQTIGPFNAKWTRIVARLLTNGSQAVVVRDQQSLEFLHILGINAPSLLATDVAMRLGYQAPQRRSTDGVVRVGLNPSGLLVHGGQKGNNQFDLRSDYGDLLRAILAEFAAMDSVEIHLVGHVLTQDGGYEDDLAICNQFAKEFPSARVAPSFKSPSEAKSYIAGLDFFMAARMHAAIAAFSSGVPVVPMAYSRKFQGVFGSLGYERVVDCRADSAEDILERIRVAFEERELVAKEVSMAMQNVDARLDAYKQLAKDQLRAACLE